MQTRLSRRRTVALLGGLATGLAGCQGLLGSGGERESSSPTESFEDGIRESMFEDVSQGSVTPAVTDAHATHGERALLLDSVPGTDTENRVRTEPTWTGPRRYSVDVKPVGETGHESSIGVYLAADESGRQLRLHSSPYHGAIQVHEYDESGEELPDPQTGVADLLSADEWTRLGFSVQESGVAVSVDDVTRELDTDWNPVGGPVHLDLTANGWGSGDPVAAVFDAVLVEPL